MSEKSRIESVIASIPLNSTASRIMSKGIHYEHEFKPAAHIYHADVPPPMRPLSSLNENARKTCGDLVGKKFGRFTVVGLGVSVGQNANASWAVRCSCGQYEMRKAKSIRNPANSEDCCKECRNLEFIKRRYKQLGSRPVSAFKNGGPA